MDPKSAEPDFGWMLRICLRTLVVIPADLRLETFFYAIKELVNPCNVFQLKTTSLYFGVLFSLAECLWESHSIVRYVSPQTPTLSLKYNGAPLIYLQINWKPIK